MKRVPFDLRNPLTGEQDQPDYGNNMFIIAIIETGEW